MSGRLWRALGCLLAVCFLKMPVVLARQQPPRVVVLHWEDVSHRALRDNLQLQERRLEVAFQDREQKKVFSSWFPRLVYQATLTRNIELPEFVFNINGVEQRFRVGSRYSQIHTLQIQWPLFLGGQRWYHWQAQRWQYRSLREALAREEQSVVREALRLYFGILLAQEQIKARHAARQAALENLHQARVRFLEGVVTRLDTLRARSLLAATWPALLDARRQEQQLRQQLKALLQIPMEDSLIVEDSLQTRVFSPEIAGRTLQQWQSLALEHRGELKALQASRMSARQERKSVRGSFLPRIALGYTLDQQAQVNQPWPQAEDFVRAQRATLSLEWTLFQGGERALSLQQMRIREKQLALRLKALRRQIQLEVEQAFLAWQQARAQLQSLQEGFREARESHRLASLFFQEGQATQLDVINAQARLTESWLALAQGIFQYNMAQVDLLFNAGLLSEIWSSY